MDNTQDQNTAVIQANNQVQLEQNLSDEDQANTFEQILTKIGIGKFNYINNTIIGMGILMDGAEIIAISILNYVFVNSYWFVTTEQVSLLGSTLFFGIFVGSLISGYISDKYGRKIPFIIYLFLAFITSVWSAVSNSFTLVVISRAIYGGIFGLITPLVATYFSETSPKNTRGKVYVVYGAISFTIGEFVTILIADKLSVEERDSQNWRYMLIWCSFPAIISGCLGLFLLKESPRFALLQNFQKGIDILKFMFKRNHNGQELQIPEPDLQTLQEWTEEKNEEKKDKLSYSLLFKGSNFRTTVCLWFVWFGVNFTYYGVVYILPLITNSGHQFQYLKYEDLYVSILSEFPSHFITYFVVEHPELGRKQLLIVFSLLSGVGAFGAFLFPGVYLFFVLITKLSATVVFNILTSFTPECYSTECRVTGIGCASSVARISGVTMPWIVVPALKVSKFFPFVVVGTFGLISALAVYLLKYETAGKALDLNREKLEAELAQDENEEQKGLISDQ